MDLKDIKELIRYFDKSDLGELEIENNDTRLYLSKYNPNAYVAQQMPVAPVQYAQPAQASAAAPAVAADAPKAAVSEEKGNIIESPMIGTYYEASSPGAASFANVGDVVEKGQTLCIIEAMKIMNAIEAEYRCKIVKMFAKNGSPVEYGQDLFLVEPM